MIIRNWQDSAAYQAMGNLNRAQWAWEFLRRNEAYQREWLVFMQTWRALVAAYGAPPNRDFCAWKLDPRAWVPAAECAESDCRVDQDKVLIECALGARWGFYKFPPDPADDDPVGNNRLNWREQQECAVHVDADDSSWLGERDDRVAFGFDLGLPLREQIERTKRQLQILQRHRLRSGRLTLRSIRGISAHLAEALRLLDALAAGASRQQCNERVPGGGCTLDQAEHLRDGGYLELVLLPE